MGGGADRVTEIDRLLEQKPRLTADQAWDVIRQTSRQDLNLRLFLPTLQAATSGLTQSDPRRQLVDTLTRWDGINLLNDDGKKKIIKSWQNKKSLEIKHPFLEEKVEWGMVPYVQSLLLARCLRGDLDGYPPFMWK